MGMFNQWFGATKPVTKNKGQADFNLYQRQTRSSFKRATKNLNYQDRQKALALDEKIRQGRTSAISHSQYLKEAKKEYGYNSGFVRRLKDQALTSYTKTGGLSEVRKRMNIYDIQQQRVEEEKKHLAGPQFATQADPTKSQATASRLGASPGQIVQKPTDANVDRPVLGQPTPTAK